jgi:hypothetical protein
MPVFKVSDKVWLEGKDITTDQPTKKLDDLRLGPCETLEKVGASAWKLRLPETDGHHLVFNELLFLLYVEPPAHQREEQPALQIIGGEEYKVEEIMNHRKCG